MKQITKITLPSSEEIDLSEREQEIYNQAYEDGYNKGSDWMMKVWIILVAISTVVIGYILTHKEILD